ncbi:hypothetical protein PR202_gb04758 [Eleusine coracana subsp. coracana]|uniref:Uncharacterized protein n=1 Tax=Eleusine coracana subsp. coracana TaxID=191504 RepID=A0AAV5E647_ELECO|nr:hypothetical protein PR202_gb04758 [Eleusine coracana subsp. coracana]
MAYRRAPGSSNCYICGEAGHFEHFCPYNYIYGLYDDRTCRGECTPGPEQHRITSRIHYKFLQCSVRVNNMPPGFREWDLKELFSPFGPLLMWDVPRLINKTCYCRSEIHLSFGVVVFKKREDGENAVHELNGYESGGHKLRIDWFYPSCDGKISKEQPAMQGEANCLPTSPWITVPKQGGRFGIHLASVRRKISKERPALQGVVNQRLVVFHFPKFRRFVNLQKMLFVRQRKVKGEQEKDMVLVNKMALRKDSTRDECATSFWKDQDATFCSICGDDSEEHLELMCPYNYLSPTAYSPCKARLALWANYTTTLRYTCSRNHGEEHRREIPVYDETNSRRFGFLRCFVRVNDLPEQCHQEEVAALFSRFGPLRMCHVVTRRSGGFGAIVFQNRDHADEAIVALNCFDFGDRKLRVDWAYPCLNC